ncbi:MAG TPA: TraR/DksA family transcriptional regulator [Candidatus Sulfotelmatobacter sp.]|nr:TraR/DksA family transcriptional regulator [Candidatus Sulfotelmatobacter sp.]
MKSSDVLRLQKYLTFHLTEIQEELRNNAQGESDWKWGTRWGSSASVLKEQLIRTREEITSALSRIQKGTYGNCVGCGKEIKQQRLEVVPWLRLCIVCQEECERQWTKHTHGPRSSEVISWG